MPKIGIQIVDHDRRDFDHDFSSAKNVVEFLLPVAKSIVDTEGEAEPMLLVIAIDKIYFIRVAEFFCDEHGKDAFRDFVVNICQKPEVEGIGLVTEAWVVMRERFDTFTGEVSEQPDRGEVLMIYSEWVDGTIVDVMVPISIDENGKKKTNEPQFLEASGSVGRMRGFFTKPENVTVH